MAEQQLPDDGLRVGHLERERAITLLNDAFSAGYLEVSEFEDRSGLIYAARTRGDLRSALAELPNAALLFPTDAPAVTGTAAPAATSQEHLNADWETLRRKGTWRVAPSILVTASWGTVDLDFTKATFAGPSVDLQVQTSATTVKLKLAADQEIRIASLEKTGLSSVKDKAGPPHRPGGPVITVAGSISAMSSVVVKRAGGLFG